jgi:hypothetical protein
VTFRWPSGVGRDLGLSSCFTCRARSIGSDRSLRSIGVSAISGSGHLLLGRHALGNGSSHRLQRFESERELAMALGQAEFLSGAVLRMPTESAHVDTPEPEDPPTSSIANDRRALIDADEGVRPVAAGDD